MSVVGSIRVSARRRGAEMVLNQRQNRRNIGHAGTGRKGGWLWQLHVFTKIRRCLVERVVAAGE